MADDGGSGCYVSGNTVRSHFDRTIVSVHDTHAEAVAALMALPALEEARVADAKLASKLLEEMQRPPARQRRMIDDF
jgi:hypothetical protein